MAKTNYFARLFSAVSGIRVLSKLQGNFMAQIHIPDKRAIEIWKFQELVLAVACVLLWLVILFPHHYWMIRHGNKIPSDQISEGA
jgi:hypothetical protein